MIKYRTIAILAMTLAFLSNSDFNRCHADLVMTFEDIAAGTTYDLGEVIDSGGLQLLVAGPGVFNTVTRVTSSGFSGQGNALESFADRELDLLLPTVVDDVRFNYRMSGGIGFLEINGANSGAVSDFSQLNGTVLGGVQISVSGSPGLVQLDGNIASLTIAGQELLLDNVFVAIPEPSGFIGLLLLLGLASARRQRSYALLDSI